MYKFFRSMTRFQQSPWDKRKKKDEIKEMVYLSFERKLETDAILLAVRSFVKKAIEGVL